MQLHMDWGLDRRLEGRAEFYLYAACLLLVLFGFLAVWVRYIDFLYVGRDGDYSLWISETYRAWANPASITAINPYQGMTSMLVAINPYPNPGDWIFASSALAISVKKVTAFAVYYLEVTVSTFALFAIMGFARPLCLAISIWVALLLFPPFNFIFGLQGWLATAPLYGNTVALMNIIACLLLLVGHPHPLYLQSRPIAFNVLLASLIVLLVFCLLVAAPFYNAGMMLGLILVLGIITLSSVSWSQFAWRCACGVYVGIALYSAGVVQFYGATEQFSVRFAGGGPFPMTVVWPSESWAVLWRQTSSTLCDQGVACFPDDVPIFPGFLGTYWLHAVILLGAAAVGATFPKPLSRMGIVFGLLWFTLLVVWTLAASGFLILSNFAPVYFYLPMTPFLALFSLCGIVVPISMASSRSAPAAYLSYRGAIVCLVVSGILSAAAVSVGASPLIWRRVLHHTPQSPSSPITATLVQELALQPGTAFRGSVATILGARNGSLRKRAGLASDVPVRAFQFLDFDAAVKADTGSDHHFLDLWWLGVPTFSEYGQGISRPMAFIAANFLSYPDDAPTRNYLVPTRANIPVLQSLGVRFVVTDGELHSAGTTLKGEVALSHGGLIRLYELPRPNLGGYSPVKLSAIGSAKNFVDRVEVDPSILQTEAYVFGHETLERDGQLVPAANSTMLFEKGGVHVTAKSAGHSAVLLPLQFSHCYEVEGAAGTEARIVRANIAQTLIIFDRLLDVRLRWRFRFLGKEACRQRDVVDIEELGL